MKVNEMEVNEMEVNDCEVIHVCIEVQLEYSNIPMQDRIYITFGRIVTEKDCHDDDLLRIINTIKSEFEFLEGVWNDKEGKG